IDVMDGNRHRVRFANYIVAVLSVVFEHAIDIGWLAENPAKGVRKIKTEVKHHLPWPPEVVDAYRQVASDHALLAMELGIATGQRPSDLVKLRWCDWDGEGFTLVQGKTGRELYIPATRRLRQALARAPQRSPFVLTGQEGRPLTYSGLAQAMSRACKRAGIKGYTPHGWRYTAAHELAALGCSDDEIAAITGHTSRAMVAQYSGFIRQKARAKKAQDKRD
ncbi:MAG: tyrosine-type recombinase/integrase, partial [Pseudomonadota bacterium]